MAAIPLLSIILFTIVLRIPSLFEPFWYGDEGVYFTVANALNNGLPLYNGIFDNKPPLLYLLYSNSVNFLGHNLWGIRLILLLWTIGTIVIFFYLAKKLLNSQKLAILATLMLAILTSLPFLEGNIANAENFFIFFTISGFLLGLKKNYFWAGFSFCLAFLFKFPAIFDFLALGGIVFAISLTELLKRKRPNEFVKSFFPLCLGFLVPLSLTILYFLFNSRLDDFLFATLKSNVSYTNWGNFFIIPNGLLIVKLIPIIIIYIIFLFKLFKSGAASRQLLITSFLLILWLFFSFYGSLFGGRTYTHYLIQTFPALSLLTIWVLTQKKFRNLAVATLAIFILSSLYFFKPSFSLTKLSYYQNFILYLTNKMPQEKYNDTFDSKVTRNLSISRYISEKTKKADYIYVWASEPQIYFLADRLPASRYVTAYHVWSINGAYDETAESILTNQPKLILVEDNQPNFYSLEIILKDNYHSLGKFDRLEIYEKN
ncbi:MAG: hypothetical protein A2Y57_02565 [Candidatus Woykebacteria bacterium RBG_13_40_7b]|uniref:Glycosyltransferase RgtA/B/C/D-like domain-containing protein n=1 Tax=Candidatus Woykebacteria bacterium RBG_13_40_7b TaxID=1802594 RepID=A0A1G1WBN8_9BACT|nr:MAG: hypothetical protein A2Y57_02565 [Candidatus Woykebacteria bacterium RBG_13_40_7b]